MIEWNLKELDISEIKEFSKNPRQISKDQLKKLKETIDEFGLIDKPIVNLDLTLIGGHQRVSIFKKNKKKKITCWVPDRQLDEDEIKRLCIKLNKHHGSWDWDIMSSHWEPEELLEEGFSEDEIFGHFETIEEKEKGTKSKKLKMCPSCGHEF